ncbi:Aste57867_3084 [Aphanomyces stellatus]|uniref:Aste57867_3084 protein n=1 Tax=Aphanomyces stellatus TaxID=120398 RepID=A0A485KD97_9STRA|nr:hypothetical protein As57867_003075 [Aphanomyces stellatus]VFT80263.1 Aste57867_3084 [Aphanomyces stellatus]
MNILDLGFFEAIQSLQHRSSASSIDELVANVLRVFAAYPHERLNHIIMTLQACLVETMRVFGDNTYKVPHLAKAKNERKGALPDNVTCPRTTFDTAKTALAAVDEGVMELKFQSELREAQAEADLSRLLASMSVDDDVADILEEMGRVPSMNVLRSVEGFSGFVGGLKGLLFQKVLTQATNATKDDDLPDLANVYSSDMEDLVWASMSMHSLWVIPSQVLVISYLLYQEIGLAAFAGMGVIILSLVLGTYVSTEGTQKVSWQI